MNQSTHNLAASSTSTQKRGFAAMSRDHVKAIARKGGKAAHEKGKAHQFTAEEARVAGAKGGRATHAKRRQLLTAAVGGIISGASAAPNPAKGANLDNPCKSTGDKMGCGGKGGCNAFERTDGTPCTEQDANKDTSVNEGGTVGSDLADDAMGSDKMGCGGRNGCGSSS